MISFYFLGDRWPATFRRIPGFEKLGRELEQAVEAGERVHVSLGTGTVIGSEGAPALAGLAILARVAALTAMSDKPVVVTSGDGAMTILAQDTLRSAYSGAGAELRYQPTSSRMLGPTAYSYTAGVPSLLENEEVSVHLLNGSFGSEGALSADFGNRAGAFVLAGADDVQSQALFYATADEPLIGEEIFAGGAYLEVGELHKASLRAQDILRFGVIALILLGALLHTFGVIP
jgi:hypothetical protein